MERLLNSQKNSENFNTLFSDVVKHSCIPQLWDSTADTSDISNPLLKAIAQYKNHPSTRVSKNPFKNLSNTSSFHNVDESDSDKEMMNLYKSEALQNSYIPARFIKDDLQSWS